ncbi:hypothetical protein K435DRAFT_727026 [Dendrothele bispora CBS 962.96]|uniref:Spc7 kinetochore protein domain-containing protein n=1 Tax=Dendrothele bispora (strain CBS 962.96) TaxID=1314807 RepID=A0A4S8LRN4_DENBC|nr:hypothetical protein K435DRAFT_727026 [Dendrothele bispora CBS 962.96]
MPISKDTSKRRQSIAVAHPSDAIVARPKRRRATSVAPDEESPLARSKRLSLGPLRGILKRRSSSQPPTSRTSLSSSQEDPNGAESMDLTTDFQEPIRDNFVRKSMGRRVSFNSQSQVRLFQSNVGDTTTSSTSSSSGELEFNGHSSDDPPSSPAAPSVVNDENAYPGATARSRRSSGRKSFAGSEDMDITSTSLYPPGDESALVDEELDMDQGSDMDVTVAYTSNAMRKRSLSFGIGAQQRPRASTNTGQIGQEVGDASEDHSQSFMSEGSMMSEQSEPMEFTVPVGQSLRPAHQDEAWVALVKATHSGVASMEDSDNENDGNGGDIDMDDAVARIMKARNSLNLNQGVDDSMSMSEDSFAEDVDLGNDTIDISRMMKRGFGRESIALPRESIDYQDSTMDESGIYGSAQLPITSTPRASLAAVGLDLPDFLSDPPTPRPQQPPQPVEPAGTSRNPVFSLPPSGTAPTTGSKPPTSPAKGNKTPTKTPARVFTAAFAPPVSKPSPKKPPAPEQASSSSLKRPRPSVDPAHNDETDRPSPAKRQALASKWNNTASPATGQRPSSTSPTEERRPLDPKKRAPFQAAPTAETDKPALKKTTSGMRRPSNYFSRRKSLALLPPPPEVDENMDVDTEEPPNVIRTSPKKKAGIGLGRARASMSSATSSDAWKRFDRNAEPVGVDSGKGKGKDKAVEPPTEEPRQAQSLVSSSTPPRPQVTTQEDSGPPSPAVPVLDLSTYLNSETGEDEESPGDAIMDTAAATEQWRDAIPSDGYSADEVPPISIEQFFVMTDIKFMDELTAPRRSMHPSQQTRHQPRNPSDISLAEYAVAMGIDVPQLALYTRVAKDLEAWMKQSKVVFEQAQEEATKMTPELFAEYSRSDENAQQELKHQLKLIRTNTRGQAKSDWYDWKLQWIEGLRIPAQKAFNDLENDAKALEKVKAQCDEVLPSLEQEYEAVTRELEKERTEVAAIEECDQDYLNDLKSSIADQNIELDALKNETKENLDQLDWLKERLADIEAQKREATVAITEANRLLDLQQNGTRSEVFKLKEELETLEDLHMFHASKVDANMFEYVYAWTYRVSIPCKKYLPLVEKIDIVSLPEMRTKHKEEFPKLKDFLLSAAKHMIRNSGELTTRQIVHKLADYWSSCSQLCTQIRYLSLRYPIEFEFSQSSTKPFSEFRTNVPILFPSVKSKVVVSFVFNRDAFSRWPMSIKSLRYEVIVAFGRANVQEIESAILARLNEASPQDSFACLLDACMVVQEC